MAKEENSGSEVTVIGNARLSGGARQVLSELTPAHCKSIRECKPLSQAETMAKGWKSTPQTVDLAIMLAGLIHADEGEVAQRNFMTTMKARWPALDLSYLKAVREAVRHVLKAGERAAVKGDDTNVIDEDNYQEMCNYALAKLQSENKFNPTLFQRDGRWCEIQELGDPKAARIAYLDRDTFAARLNAATFWRKRTGEGTSFRYVSAPKDVVNQVFAHPQKPVPELRGVVTAPMFTREGKLLITPGYHSSGFYYAPGEGLDVPRPPSKITEENLAEARDTLVDILCDFEMDGVSRAALEAAVLRGEGAPSWGSGASATPVPPSFLSAVGFLLEQIMRPMIDGPVMPLLISKTARRAGGGLLSTVMQTVICGSAGMRPLAGNEDERRKAILAALASGTAVVAWDNLPTGRTIDSPTLATLFTEGVFIDRELRASVERAIPVRASFMMIGNRPPFSDELVQRLTMLELIPQTARPEHRTGWKHDNLDTYVKEHRGRILGALLVLAKNWIDRGQPKPVHPPVIGRFERYRQVIGGILEAASPHWTSWQSNREKLAKVARDEEEDGWTELFKKWSDERGTGPAGSIEARDLADIAQEHEIGLDAARIREGGQFEYNTRSLSKMLSGMQERIFDLGEHGNVKLLQSQKRGKGGYPWYLEPVAVQLEAETKASNVSPLPRPRGWRSMTDEERATWETMGPEEQDAIRQRMKKKAA